MGIYISKKSHPRIVIIGGGFGGLQLAESLRKLNYQVVLIDKNNFHQFQPLFYQVATSGLEPSSIIFPFRKIFQKHPDFHFRLLEVERIDTANQHVVTNDGIIEYDHLVIATGACNNFFGNKNVEQFALPMKSINESLKLRNIILERFEQALGIEYDKRAPYISFVIAGAGPTGVELAGTLAEMKTKILPKDYPDLDLKRMRIILVEGSDRVLNAMSNEASTKAKYYLEKLGVELRLETLVQDCSSTAVVLNDGTTIDAHTLIWAAGIKGNFLEGVEEDKKVRGNRIAVNEFNQVIGHENVYAVGDIASMNGDPEYPNGHPQLAQAAMQQAKNVAKNFKNIQDRKALVPFRYKNLGTMATVGRNKAVVDLPKRKFSGFFAWLVWMLVHLRSILGIKNKWIVFMNWVWNYFTYNLSLRLIIKRKDD